MTPEELFERAQAFDAIAKLLAIEEEWTADTLDAIRDIVIDVEPNAFRPQEEIDALIAFAESAIQVADERMHAPNNDYTDGDRSRFEHRVILANRAIDQLRKDE